MAGSLAAARSCEVVAVDAAETGSNSGKFVVAGLVIFWPLLDERIEMVVVVVVVVGFFYLCTFWMCNAYITSRFYHDPNVLSLVSVYAML